MRSYAFFKGVLCNASVVALMCKTVKFFCCTLELYVLEWEWSGCVSLHSLFDNCLCCVVFRRPQMRSPMQNKQDVQATTKKEEDDDNWDLPEGDTPY